MEQNTKMFEQCQLPDILHVIFSPLQNIWVNWSWRSKNLIGLGESILEVMLKLQTFAPISYNSLKKKKKGFIFVTEMCRF